mgnify:CR=1 FL=1
MNARGKLTFNRAREHEEWKRAASLNPGILLSLSLSRVRGICTDAELRETGSSDGQSVVERARTLGRRPSQVESGGCLRF